MAAAVRKKQDDRHLKALRELGSLGANRECFDCGQRGPTYVNVTIGSFVCSQCSGVLRGLTPPHRVKSISMATFTQEELDFVKAHGNDECGKTWLGLLADPKSRGQQPAQDYREHIIDKYEKQRYYLQPASPLKSIAAATTMANGGGMRSSPSSCSPSSPSSSSAHSADQNNNNSNHNNTVIQQNQLNLKAIQLTPPAATNRTSGRHHQQNNNNAANSSRLNNSQSRGINGSSAFAEDSLFSEVSTKQQQVLQNQQQWVNLNNNNISGSSSSIGSLFATGSNGTGLVNGSSSNGHQGGLTMTPGQQQQQQQRQLTSAGGSGDFVADFGSADIFNANVINGGQRSNGGDGGGGALKRTNAVQRRNGTGESNGAAATPIKPQENFADFEHNAIFNSAEYNMVQQQPQKCPAQQNSQPATTTIMGCSAADGSAIPSTGSYNFNIPLPSWPMYSNMGNMENSSSSPRFTTGPAVGVDVGGGGNTAIPFQYFNAPFGQPIYSNFWQPLHLCYQPPFAQYRCAPSPADHQNVNNQVQNIQNPNRWSVPMSMSSSNSSMASTPSADRYAALKDLDEQIREIKEKEIVVQQPPPAAAAAATPFSNPNPFKAAFTAPISSFPSSGTNPFKTDTNGFSGMAQQQQQQAPQHFQPVQFNGFAPSINGFQNGGNMFGIGLNATGGQKSNNPFL